MTLHDALTRLSTDGGDHNRLVLQGARGWIVVHGGLHLDEVEVEAAASHYLESPLAIGDVAKLRQAGFASRANKRTLMRRSSLGPELADALSSWMREVYGDTTFETELTLGDREATRNPVLLEAIRVLSKKRDMPSRHQVYRRFLDGTFLWPRTGDTPTAFGELSGWEVLGVFTDWDELAWHDPRGVPYDTIGGRELIKQLVERPKVGSLLINPKGRVGGELYRNELQTMRSAIRT